MSERQNDESAFLWRHLKFVSVLGMVLTLNIFVFFIAGYFVADFFGLGSWVIVLAIFAGAFSALYWVFKKVSALLGEISNNHTDSFNDNSDNARFDQFNKDAKK